MIDTYLAQIHDDLKTASDPAVTESGKRFFKEGEHFRAYGLKSGDVKRLSKKYTAELKDLPRSDLFRICESLWQSGYQEEAGIACALSESMGAESEPSDFDIYANLVEQYVKNWAMCDTLCNHTIGDLVMKYPELAERLLEWTHSDNRWMKRGAAVTLIIPARRGLFLPLVFQIAETLLYDPNDLVQKGYGWMLKAASEAHQDAVFDFVVKHKASMPRTALRYAIEKMPAEKKQIAMKKDS